MLRSLTAAVVLASLLVGCGGDDATAPDLAGTDWVVTALRFGDTEVQVLDRSLVTARFSADRVSGDMGCNGYAVAYFLDGERLSFGQSSVTGAACSDPAVSAQEGAFLDAFFTADRLRATSDELVLESGGDVVVRFAPAAPLPLDGIRWTLTSTIERTEITLQVGSSGAVAGSAGCNEYFGTVETSGDALVVRDLAATERGCAGPDGVMDQETAYLEALSTVASFRTTLTHLELLDGGGEVVAEFRFGGRL